MAELIITLNYQIIKKLTLAEAKYLVGRSNQCDIVLNERTVSLEHAQLVSIGEECYLEDLQSTNGVYVNRVRTQKHVLADEDLIQIGKYELRYRSRIDPYQALYELSSSAEDSQTDLEYAQLEILNLERIGYFIPLKEKQINLSISDSEPISIEITPQGDYLLHSVDQQNQPSSYPLQANDSFKVGELELKFHPATKLAKL